MSTVENPKHTFNENCPRPPIPGEETEVTGSHSPTAYSSWSSKYNKGGGSPILTPRRSSLAYSTSGIQDAGAPLGFEPEGSCNSAFMEVGGGSHSPPPYLRWARNLHSLLEDPDGVELFRRYLEQEGQPHADTLDFWFACEGLKKQQDPDKINQLVKVIYRRFFLKTQLAIPDELRKEVNRHIKEGKDLLAGNVFDGVQAEVENLINETTYPNFLKSDMYLQHVQVMQNGELSLVSTSSSSSSSSSGSSSGGGRDLSHGGPPLPTLYEDIEFVAEMGNSGCSKLPVIGHDVLPLTRDMLIATQKKRASELRPKPEAYVRMCLQHAHFHFALTPHPHMAYSSYNPVSRQDSELQSLSSEARTESDNMSLKDSSVDGMSVSHSHCTNKKQYQHDSKRMKESARMNRDPYMHHTMIPRTQRIQKEQVHPMKPDQFAAILIEKLEWIRREQEAQEKLDRKLQEGELVAGMEDVSLTEAMAAPFTDDIREKLLVEDDSDQAILDQHVLRVWSDLTPSRSPGLTSPRPKSPEGRRRILPGTAINLNKASTTGALLPGAAIPSHSSSVPHPYQTHSRPAYYPRHMRKEKDVFSTFSSDSGNVHDFPEGPEQKHHGGSGHMPKSKSMSDYQDAQKQDAYLPKPGHDFRIRQSKDSNRKSSSKETLTDLTDSGVSVVSDSTPIMHPSAQCKDNRVLSWLKESDKQVSSVLHSHSEREGAKHRIRRNDPSATSPVAIRHNRKSAAVFATSRSGSLERGSNGGAWGPAQPFVADPSMPPLPLPHTATQLEEARRRLLEEDGRPKTVRQRFGASSSKTAGAMMHVSMDAALSGQSTLRKSLRGGRNLMLGGAIYMEGPEFTTVVFSFCDEQFPYRTKIPGRAITLRQFKEYLPKKGSYRYFFKTECDDLDMKVIQEEITDDNEVLPLWEGKIMAQVKPVE
ncbi:axin isoform X2 [Cryptotermes secundus]|uniref:axin isoform X2 n=1 Tax=Cryptotermes secundus TaxID=105785 RepID=UPI000CD7D3EC|nr:axin isoform X2 [Cryptotermes secundus]